MSVLWNADEIAQATGGIKVGQWEVTGVAIDSRALQPGDLFVPLKDTRDGHDFIPAALEAGAKAVLSSRPGVGECMVYVGSTRFALEQLAVAARDRSRAVRIGVTGSVGKTTTVRFLEYLLSQYGAVHASQKSHNNHLGVPLTLANLSATAEYGVFEMGMNHAGELSDLSQLVTPQIAVITAIGKAHLGHFASVTEIARAKAEIMNGMVPGSLVILPRDSQHYDLLADYAQERDLQVISFGTHPDSTYWTQAEDRHLVHVIGPKRRTWTGANLTATPHFASLLGIGLAVIDTLSLDPETCLPHLLQWQVPAGRGQVRYVHLAGEAKYTLIDDTYNANPTSMHAALERLGGYPGYKVAILGEMKELGGYAQAEHERLAKSVRTAGIDEVICVGSQMRFLFNELSLDKRYFPTVTAALEQVSLSQWPADTTVLAKGSRSVQLEKLLQNFEQG